MDNLTPTQPSSTGPGDHSQAVGRRSQPKCHPANRRFYTRLEALRDAATEEGRTRQARSFARALQSLRRYPLPILSAHDASGLKGVAKVIASVFQEVLEAGDAEAPADDTLWRTTVRKRWLKALGSQTAAGVPVASAAGSSQGGRFRRKLGRRSLSQKTSCALKAAVAEPQAVLQAREAAPVAIVPLSACSAGRPSLAAACRRGAAARINAPPKGSAAWSLLVSLGLYSQTAPDRTLSREELTRCIEQKLVPEVPGCANMTLAAVERLKGRRLVEEVASSRYRLTPLGSTLADSLVRKLEVPLTALSPLHVRRAAAAASSSQVVPASPLREAAISNQLVPASPPQGHATKKASQGSSYDEEDDKPLNLLVPGSSSWQVAIPSPQRTRPSREATTEPGSVVPSSLHFGEHAIVPVDRAHPDQNPSSQSSHRYEQPTGLTQFEYQPQSQQQAPVPVQDMVPLSRKKKGKRKSSSLLPKSAAAHAAKTAKTRRPLLHCESPCPRSPMQALVAATPPRAAFGESPAASRPSWPSPQAQLVLLLDHREVGAGREHAARGALQADLGKRLGEAAVESRSLTLGDVLWIWRDEAVDGSTHPHEFVAGWVVERKTFHDLSSSIMDGRYDEQKIRLLEAPGLDGVIYLIEGSQPLFGVGESSRSNEQRAQGRGFGQRLLKHSLPPATLSTTAAHTQFISGFHVAHATNTSHTISLLADLHRVLQSRGPPVCQTSSEPVHYRDFAERTRKSCHARVIEAFGRMLRMVPHCGPEATEALVDEFQTPHALAVALRSYSDRELLMRLKERRGGRAPVAAPTLAACREMFA